MHRRQIKFIMHLVLWLSLLIGLGFAPESDFIESQTANAAHPIPDGFIQEDMFVSAYQKPMHLTSIIPNVVVSNLFKKSHCPDDVGRKVRTILFDANDSANDFKKAQDGSVSSGLWYTNYIIHTEVPKSTTDDFLTNLAVTTTTHDPINSNIFYMGTGEEIDDTHEIRGASIFKPIDIGGGWLQVVHGKEVKTCISKDN